MTSDGWAVEWNIGNRKKEGSRSRSKNGSDDSSGICDETSGISDETSGIRGILRLTFYGFLLIFHRPQLRSRSPLPSRHSASLLSGDLPSPDLSPFNISHLIFIFLFLQEIQAVLALSLLAAIKVCLLFRKTIWHG